MKKIIIPVLALAALALAASCDTKKCYCYEGGYEEVEYVLADKACSSQSTTNRGCIEESERGSFDPRQTGRRYVNL